MSDAVTPTPLSAKPAGQTGAVQPETPATRAMHGIVLFGHGARDPRWAEPFERLAAQVGALQGREAAASAPVALAYLELMTPDLPTAIAQQVMAGCRTITVVPIFFGRGAHLRRDFPALLEQCRTAHPGVAIQATDAVGEEATVINAIAQFVMRSVPSR